MTNAEIVAAAKRAGIPIYLDLGIINCGGPAIIRDNDMATGSALAIVAILAAFKRDMWSFAIVSCNVLDVNVGWIIEWQVMNQQPCEIVMEGATLIDACLAALVAAYPPEDATP